MNRRPLYAVLALSSLSTLAACGSDEPAPVRSTALALDGTYRPTQEGAIASITFSHGKDYYLVPSGCAGGDCVDIGTYRLDERTSTVVLKNGDSGREQTIALEDVKTSDAAVALVKSFAGTRDFTEPESLIRRGQQTTGGQGQTTEGQGQASGDQQGLNGGGQQGLTDKIVDLFKTIVEAVMNQQKMKKDDDDKKKDDAKKDGEEKEEPNPLDCTQGVPTNESTPAEKLAYAARCPNGP